MNFGHWLKEARGSRGISLKALSKEIGVDRAYLSRVEAGKVSPSDGLIEKLAKALNRDKDDLLLLAGHIPASLLEAIHKNPHESVKRLKTSFAESIAEPVASYGRTLVSSGDRAIEDGFPFEYISDIAELESYRKEVNRPIYHIHKWWAQRLGSVFRAILLSAVAPKGSNIREMFYQPVRMTGMTVFDPFMGSGTTLGEALKLGARVIGRDINPVSHFIVKTSLEKYSRHEIVRTYEEIKNDVADTLTSFYKARGRHGHLLDVLYYFWVKTVPCPACKKDVDLFSSYIFSKHAYPAKNPEAKALCPHCGKINDCHYDAERLKCSGCKKSFNPQTGPAQGVNAHCPHCSHMFPIAKTINAFGYVPSHRMYAKMVLKGDGTKEYLPIDDFDLDLYASASRRLLKQKNPYPPTEIQPGYNTNQVLNYNYRYWHQMFNNRQLLCLSILADRIKEIRDDSLRSLFACLFSGCLEFNNMFASFKGEGTGAVRHMFSHHILKPERTPLEANLWGTPRSSGSFSTLFQSRVLRAFEYRENPFELRVGRVNGKISGNKIFSLSKPLGSDIAGTFGEFNAKNLDIYLSSGDSSATDLPDSSIDLVVTDPPFFDNVHYSELADFFYVWLRHILGSKGAFRPETTRAAQEVQNRDPEVFSRNLTSVFRECNRVLRPEGLLIFTYHHSRHEGWIAVLEAVVEGGFVICLTHPIKSEMSVATPKQQTKEPIDLDIIVVCRKRSEWRLKESVEPDFLTNAKMAGKEQISRFNAEGRELSRNDIRIVLTGQIVSRLSQLEDEKLMEILLRKYEDRIERDIGHLFDDQNVMDRKSLAAQTSFL